LRNKYFSEKEEINRIDFEGKVAELATTADVPPSGMVGLVIIIILFPQGGGNVLYHLFHYVNDLSTL
jgi:hypothetical protein